MINFSTSLVLIGIETDMSQSLGSGHASVNGVMTLEQLNRYMQRKRDLSSFIASSWASSRERHPFNAELSRILDSDFPSPALRYNAEDGSTLVPIFDGESDDHDAEDDEPSSVPTAAPNAPSDSTATIQPSQLLRTGYIEEWSRPPIYFPEPGAVGQAAAATPVASNASIERNTTKTSRKRVAEPYAPTRQRRKLNTSAELPSNDNLQSASGSASVEPPKGKRSGGNQGQAKRGRGRDSPQSQGKSATEIYREAVANLSLEQARTSQVAAFAPTSDYEQPHQPGGVLQPVLWSAPPLPAAATSDFDASTYLAQPRTINALQIWSAPGSATGLAVDPATVTGTQQRQQQSSAPFSLGNLYNNYIADHMATTSAVAPYQPWGLYPTTHPSANQQYQPSINAAGPGSSLYYTLPAHTNAANPSAEYLLEEILGPGNDNVADTQGNGWDESSM